MVSLDINLLYNVYDEGKGQARIACAAADAFLLPTFARLESKNCCIVYLVGRAREPVYSLPDTL